MTFLLLLLLGCKGGKDDTSADGGTSDGGGDGGGTTDGGGPTDGGGGTTDGGGGDAGATAYMGPPIVTVSGPLDRLVADGRGMLDLELRVEDGAGFLAPVGTPLDLTVSLGRLGELQWEGEGRARLSFTTGTWPGEAVLGLGVEGELRGMDRLTLLDAPGFGTQLHTHGSLSEREGTMMDGDAIAQAQDIDVMWWTDHDQRYHPDGYYEFEGFTFDEEEAPMATGSRRLGWVADTSRMRNSTFEHRENAAYAGDRGLYIWVRSLGTASADDPQIATWEYIVGDQNNYKSLLGQVSLDFWIRPVNPTAETELYVIIPFSAKGVSSREGEYRKLVLYHSDETYASDDWTVYQKMDLVNNTWSHIEVDLSAIAEEKWPVPGLDMHAEIVIFAATSHSGSQAAWHIDELNTKMAINGPELRAAQLEYLSRMVTPIQHYVGLELSHVTDGHGGAYWPDEDWSFMPYTAPNVLLFSEAVQQIHDEGGIVSFNHIFGTLSYLYSERELDTKIEDAIEFFVENDMFGVDMLEVGYRTRGGGLEHFMEIWDRLAAEHGIIVTGIGTSDQHHPSLGVAGNNFVTWAAAPSNSAADLIDSLRRGHAWFGDPDYFLYTDNLATLKVPAHQAVMGQVVRGASEPCEAVFRASALQAGWTVVAVVDGVQVATWTVETDGVFEVGQVVDPTQDAFVRFEVHHPDAGPILYTNPIYFVAADTEVPAERLPAP